MVAIVRVRSVLGRLCLLVVGRFVRGTGGNVLGRELLHWSVGVSLGGGLGGSEIFRLVEVGRVVWPMRLGRWSAAVALFVAADGAAVLLCWGGG